MAKLKIVMIDEFGNIGTYHYPACLTIKDMVNQTFEKLEKRKTFDVNNVIEIAIKEVKNNDNES